MRNLALTFVTALTLLTIFSACRTKPPAPEPVSKEPEAKPLVISPAGGVRAENRAADAAEREGATVTTPVPPPVEVPRDANATDEKPSPFGSSKKAGNQARKSVTIPAGTWVGIRMRQSLDPNRAKPGDKFSAVLDQNIWAGGKVIAEKGATVHGVVTGTKPNARHPGEVAVAVTRLETELGPVIVATGEYPLRARAPKRGSNDVAKVPSDARAGFKLSSPVTIQ